MTALLAPRSPGRAVLLALVGLALAAVSTRDALVQATARGRPDVALRLDPTHAVALNADFRRQLGEDGTAMHLAPWVKRAQRSLAASPLSASMIRMMAGDPARTDGTHLLDLAEHVSRRDPLLQLALIEAAVNANQIDVALRHYDRALSVYPDLRTVLFPVLTNAIGQPEVREALARLARGRRPWMTAFLGYAVRRTGDPRALAQLLAGLDHGPGALSDASEQEATLAGLLVGRGDYAAARALAQRAAGRDAGVIDRPGFEPATWLTGARPLTWTLAEMQGIDAHLSGDGAVTVDADPGSSGLAFFRILVVPAGRYRFAVRTVKADDETATARGRWTLVCLRAGAAAATPIADLPVDPIVAATVDVHGDCAAVRIALTVDNLDSGDDAGLTVRDLRFTLLR